MFLLYNSRPNLFFPGEYFTINHEIEYSELLRFAKILFHNRISCIYITFIWIISYLIKKNLIILLIDNIVWYINLILFSLRPFLGFILTSACEGSPSHAGLLESTLFYPDFLKVDTFVT